MPASWALRPRAALPVVEAAPRAEVDNVVPMGERCTIMELKEFSCRWPIGNPDSHDFGFCGREKTARGSYCDDHARGAFRKLASSSEVKTWAAGSVRELHTA